MSPRRYTSQHPTRRASQLVHSKLWKKPPIRRAKRGHSKMHISAPVQTLNGTCPNLCFCELLRSSEQLNVSQAKWIQITASDQTRPSDAELHVQRLATEDGTRSSRRRPVLSMCAAQSGLEYSGLNSDASEASLNNAFRMQTIKVVIRIAPQHECGIKPFTVMCARGC